MSETQLERSVLEAKERDELFAIADALGAKPGARAKKADLVTQILRATGIEPDNAEDTPEKPRRTRTRRTAAGAAAAAGSAGPDATTPEAEVALGTATDGSPEGITPNPDQPAIPVSGGPTTAPAPANQVRRPGRPRATSDTASAASTGRPEALRLDMAGDADAAEPVASTAPAGSGPAAATRPGTNGELGERVRSEPRSTEPRSPESRSPESRSPESRSPESGANGAGRGGGDSSGRHAGPAAAGQRREPHAESGATTVGDLDGESDGHGAPAAPASSSRSFDSEPGNRRNRRRRGRERFERVDRDLAGQASESQYSGEPVPVTGYLDLRDEGYGFLRTSGFLSGPGDVYVSISQVRRFALRKGDYLEGAARPAGGNEKYPALLRIDTVSGLTPEEARGRPRFENLTPLFPDQKLRLEVPGDSANMTARIVDLIAPIGKGQRGLIVSPPKAGKTTILKQIAHSIEANNPDVELLVLLVDERPEEVTDMRRSVKGEVIASTFDRPAEEHTQVAELTIERAKRMVELGRDVVIVLDGITRLARAYNLAQPATGRIMSGGIDTGALYPPKKFFGAARNIEEGGSLTILATALVETGSRMDEVIFEEFKGTGNMELRLDRKLAERRIYPAIDVNGSSTRHEELLFDRVQLQQVWKLRRVLNALSSEGSSAAGLELLMDRIKTTRTNDEFLAEVAKNASPSI